MEHIIRMGRTAMEKAVHIDLVSTLLYFEFSDTFKDHPEQHEEWELIFADRGCCDVVADERVLSLQQGEFYLHRPLERHMLQIPKGEFPNIFISAFRCSSPLLSQLAGRRLRASLTVKQHISAIMHEAIQTFDPSDKRLKIQGVLFKREDRLWGGEQSILLHLELMLIELLREHVIRREQQSPFLTKELAADPLCRRIIEYLEKHLYEKIDTTSLCEHVSFSKSYVCKHFSRVCGISLIPYFNRMKMEEAKRLIRETKLSFFEISEKLMLSNSHYFSTLFKTYVGMTPSQYKKSCK